MTRRTSPLQTTSESGDPGQERTGALYESSKLGRSRLPDGSEHATITRGAGVICLNTVNSSSLHEVDKEFGSRGLRERAERNLLRQRGKR